VAFLDKPVEYYVEKSFKNQYSWMAQEISLRLAEDGYKKTEEATDVDLKLTGSYARSKRSTDLSNAILPKDDSWSLALSMTFPPLRSSAREKSLESAKISLESSRFSYTEAKEDLIESVMQLYNTLKFDELRFKTLQSNLAIAQEALKVSEVRYGKGAITVDELISSQKARKDSRNSLISAKKDYLNNYHSFLQKTGELLVTYRPDLIKEYQLPWPK
jgi:outer membrane protein TolC